MTSPPIPPQAITAAAEVRLRQYANEYSAAHLTWEDFAHEATEVLEAARPYLAAEFLAFTEQAITDRAGEVINQAVAGERERILTAAARLTRSFQGHARDVISYDDLADLLREAQI